MNRTDEIQAVARDIAEQIAPAPEQRNVIADNLIKLVCLVVQGVGKSVACAGESDQNEALDEEFFLDTESISYSDAEEARLRAEFERVKELDASKAHGMYITGERMQDGARWVQEEAVAADLERYERSGLTPAWTSKLPPVPEQPVMELPDTCVCVPVLVHDAAGSFLGFQKCKHQQAADKTLASQHEIASQLLLTQGLAILAASFPLVPDPFTGPAPFTAGPFAPGELTQLAHQAADDMREQHKTPVPDERPLFAPGAEEYYRKVLGLGPKPCDAQDCPAHGDRGYTGRCTNGATLRQHTWVTATDGDTGATLDYVHCGVCSVRRCCCVTNPQDFEGPDVDCATHGDELGRACPGELCAGCGNPVNIGQHGPNQGFGGCA